MATNCDITQGRLEPCKQSVGGLHKIFYMNWEDVTVTLDPLTDEITDITLADAVTGITVYEWEVKKVSNLTETPTVSTENGTAFWQQELTGQFKKLDPTTRKELMLLTYGRVRAFVLDNNGNTLYVGEKFGLDVSGGSNATGANMEDFSGYNVVQMGQEPEPAKFLSGSTLEDPFAGLTTPPESVVVGT